MAAMGSPMTLSDDNPMSEFGAFYWREVGHHHNSTTQFTATSDLSFLNFPELAHPEWIETPVLTVVGERAATRALSESIHERLTTDKELLVAPGAGHVDLYHRTDLIPFESIDISGQRIGARLLSRRALGRRVFVRPHGGIFYRMGGGAHGGQRVPGSRKPVLLGRPCRRSGVRLRELRLRLRGGARPYGRVDPYILVP